MQTHATNGNSSTPIPGAVRQPGLNRVQRNQWGADHPDSAAQKAPYEQLLHCSWEDTQRIAPAYFQRLAFTVAKAKGRVLEIGCGIGTMTRWLAASPAVTEVVAVDAYAEAIDQLRALSLPGVKPVLAPMELLALGAGEFFDTVVLCEVLEHIYPEEEEAFRQRLAPHVHAGTQYIISTPIGWLEDPQHARGFTETEFAAHLEAHYGVVNRFDYTSGYSQVAVGRFRVGAPAKPPRVSVVLPSYNHAEFLPGSIASVLAQTFCDFELIIVDDGSTDGTRAYLDTIDDPRVCVIHQRNQRLPQALNNGFRAARGELFTWTSADNFCAPIFLEALVAALDHHPDAAMAIGAFALTDAAGRIRKVHRAEDLSRRAFFACNPGVAAFLYRRQCLETIGVYEPTLNGAEDWDMWLRIVERYHVVAVPELLYYYREHDDSMTARIQPDIMAASRRVIDRALARRNGGVDLQEFYPAIGECSDRELATTHATLDFGIRLLRSHVAPPELAARFLAAAFERQPDPRTAANLMVAFARCGDSTSARRLADHLRTEGQPEIRHLVELVTAETDANADRLRRAPVLELSASESELLRKLAAGRLIHSFTAGGEQLPLETNEPAVTTVPVSPQSAPKDSLAELEATIREALALRPDGVEAWQLLAALHVQRKDWVAGAQAGQRLLQLDPNNVKSLMLLAHCLLGGGDGETAILVFQQVLELEPGNTMARACLTDLTAPEAEPASEAEAYARAERNVRQVLRLEPDNVAAHRLLTNVLAGQHRWAEALPPGNRVLATEPNDVATRAVVAHCHWQLGARTTAELLFGEVLAADPQNAMAQAWQTEVQLVATPTVSVDDVTRPLAVTATPRSASVLTEEIACPFCQSRDAMRIRNAADIVECGRCHTVYLRTRMTQARMEELYQTYADDGSHMAVPKSVADASTSCLKRDYFLQEVLKWSPKRGRILDIGCGWGAFLLNARDHGFTPSGMELTRKAVRYANEALNIPVVNTQFLDTPYEAGSHQIITMLHVLEHLPQPREALEKVFQTLQPGGLFCGIVPNFASFCSQNGKDQWYWLDPNYHYVHYTPATLRRHLEAAGFVVERISTALGDYGHPMHREVAGRLNTKLHDEAAHQWFVEQLGENGQGEEIRFFARKPEVVAVAAPDCSQDDLLLRERLGHLVDAREAITIDVIIARRALLAAAIAAVDPVAFAAANRVALDQLFFGILDLRIGDARRAHDSGSARQLKALRDTLVAQSDLKPRARESGWSFCFITNGKRPGKLRRAIGSVQSLKLPNCEILIGGEPPAGFDDVPQVPVIEGARRGRLGEMRNRLLDRARFDHVVVADDDLLFQPDFFTGLEKFGDDFEVLCVRLLNPDGTRHWDWATNDGPRGHQLLPYDHTDDHVYVTGGLCIMKAEVGDRVRWSDHLGFYQGEDADFSKRLHAAGISIQFNPHSTVIHDDTRYTSLDGIILDTKAVRRRAWKLLVKGQDAETRELQTRLGRMDSTTPKQWHQFVRACALDDEEGRYSQFHPELFASVAEAGDETNHFARLASLLADVLGQIGPFYFHCGGAGDALLLLASFYDQHPDAVIVSLPNSVAAMKSFFDAFPRLKRVYFLPERPDANHHLLVRMLMKLVKNCRGVGATPYQDYSEWNAQFNIFKDRGIAEHPAWAGAFRREDRSGSVTLAPKGSLTGMIGSKRNQLDPAWWPSILQTILSAGLKPVILGTPAETSEYPALDGCVDQRSFSFAEQMEWIASSRAFVGADSWGKSFAALAGIPALVFDSQRGADWIGKKDASDFVFIDPWKDITLIRSLNEFAREFQRVLANPGVPAVVRPTGKLEINWLGSFLDYGSLSNINRVLTDTLVIQNGATIRRIQTLPVTGKLAKPLQSYRGKLATKANPHALLTVRHAWPPDWSRPAQGKLAVIQPWEFGVLPKDWVTAAANVDAFWVPSNYVRQVYIDSGVPAEKVQVLPNGIDPDVFHPEAKPMKLATKKTFKFLFVGGTIYRKGPDLLLKAYAETFTASDDVCLVIKDFGGQSVYAGQTFEQQIGEFRQRPNSPEILHLNQELSPRDLPGLYTACDCLAHPYRGEGFGLPVLEAMACGLPVLVTEGGATDDFVSEETGYRIPAVRKVFGREISGMPLAGDGWLLEPDLEAIMWVLRQVAANRDESREKGRNASVIARGNWTWRQTACRLMEYARELVGGGSPSVPDLASASSSAAKAGVVPAKSFTRKSSTVRIELPKVAKLGHLGKARELFKHGQFIPAWNATLAALAERPCHPEAYLLLAELAAQLGDGPTSRDCLECIHTLAPHWKPGRQLARVAPSRKSAGAIHLAPLPAPSDPRLSVCLIVKNEEKFLGQCLRSVRNLAHQIVVVDTGSTDRTMEIAREHGAEVHQFAWRDDFSAARNCALEHATGDWVLVLDADEELAPDSADDLRRAMTAKNVISWRLPITDQGREAEGSTYVPRLFRNAPGLFYVSRVHEQVFSSVEVRREEWGMETGVGTVKLIHHGYTSAMVKDRNKVARNLRLLELAVEEIPGDSNLLMNLGLELIRSSRPDEGLQRYAEAFAALAATPDPEITPELRETLLMQYTSHLMKFSRWRDIIGVLTAPVAQADRLSASLHFTLGLAHQELHQWAEAATQFVECLRKRGEQSFYLVNQTIRGGAPRHCLALAHWQSGAIASAAKEFSAALEEDPRLVPLRMDAARFQAEQGDPVAALKLFHELVNENTNLVDAWVRGARVALSDPEFIEFARDWTTEALKYHPTHRELIAARGETLLLSQQFVDALPFWQELNGQPRALAARLLCELMQGEFSLDGPPANEPETSREFLSWFRRLIGYQAVDGVQAVGERLELLRLVLPSAADSLSLILDEAAVEAA